MQLTLPYHQLNEYITAKAKQPIAISFVSEKEFKLSYAKKILIKEITIGINIKIEEVAPSEIALSYQAPIGIDLVIAGAISFIKTKLPEIATGLQVGEGHQLRINLKDIEKAKAVVENISLQDITFTQSSAIIDFSLKQ